ncbi:uncharacterized protein V2V93DRAFT_381889 [Kockiozyma suomiensis]|uniref:uncharacterized protein n=1 Tax=Kockiozyma suomiensis TaxID=1337062 RepID=UPI00334336B1
MSKPVYLITGANRGIGFEITRQLLSSNDADVIAVTRSSKTAGPLKDLIAAANETPEKAATSKTRLLEFDVTNPESIKAAVHELQTSGVSKVDVLINNAGILMNRGSPMSALSNLDFANILDTNVVGPHNVISAFIPMLKVEGSKKIVVNISSGLGSVEMNSGNMTGGYNVSKAALNMLTKQYSQELGSTGLTFVAVDPGWVQTDMGGKHAALKPSESVAAILETISLLKHGDNGSFINRFGKKLPF